MYLDTFPKLHQAQSVGKQVLCNTALWSPPVSFLRQVNMLRFSKITREIGKHVIQVHCNKILTQILGTYYLIMLMTTITYAVRRELEITQKKVYNAKNTMHNKNIVKVGCEFSTVTVHSSYQTITNRYILWISCHSMTVKDTENSRNVQ